jgi:hypothetical protein
MPRAFTIIYLPTSPPLSPSPSKERGGVEKRGYAPLRFPVTNYPFPSKEKVEELLKRGLPFTHLAPS